MDTPDGAGDPEDAIQDHAQKYQCDDPERIYNISMIHDSLSPFCPTVIMACYKSNLTPICTRFLSAGIKACFSPAVRLPVEAGKQREKRR
jgi:hypothetical protein